MKLEKAIEIVTPGLPADTWKLEPDLKDAIMLLVEAGKRLQHEREWGAAVSRKLLPGETE